MERPTCRPSGRSSESSATCRRRSCSTGSSTTLALVSEVSCFHGNRENDNRDYSAQCEQLEQCVYFSFSVMQILCLLGPCPPWPAWSFPQADPLSTTPTMKMLVWGQWSLQERNKSITGNILNKVTALSQARNAQPVCAVSLAGREPS